MVAQRPDSLVSSAERRFENIQYGHRKEAWVGDRGNLGSISEVCKQHDDRMQRFRKQGTQGCSVGSAEDANFVGNPSYDC